MEDHSRLPSQPPTTPFSQPSPQFSNFCITAQSNPRTCLPSRPANATAQPSQYPLTPLVVSQQRYTQPNRMNSSMNANSQFINGSFAYDNAQYAAQRQYPNSVNNASTTFPPPTPNYLFNTAHLQPTIATSQNIPFIHQSRAGAEFDRWLSLEHNDGARYAQNTNCFPSSINSTVPSRPLPQQLASIIPRSYMLGQMNNAQSSIYAIQPTTRPDYNSFQNVQTPMSAYTPSIVHTSTVYANTENSAYMTSTPRRNTSPLSVTTAAALYPTPVSLENDNTVTNSGENSLRQSPNNTNPTSMNSVNVHNPPQAGNTSSIGNRDTKGVDEITMDELLVMVKDDGYTYKEIKWLLGLWQTESALRGRYRSLTKAREDRMRKPIWPPEAKRDLIKVVDRYIAQIQGQSRRGGPLPLARILDMVPWKDVAQELKDKRHQLYGSATAKKKYKELKGLLPSRT